MWFSCPIKFLCIALLISRDNSTFFVLDLCANNALVLLPRRGRWAWDADIFFPSTNAPDELQNKYMSHSLPGTFASSSQRGDTGEQRSAVFGGAECRLAVLLGRAGCPLLPWPGIYPGRGIAEAAAGSE